MSNGLSAVLNPIHFFNDAVFEPTSNQPSACLGTLSTR